MFKIYILKDLIYTTSVMVNINTICKEPRKLQNRMVFVIYWDTLSDDINDNNSKYSS